MSTSVSYVHCLAHHLQLASVAAAKDFHNVWDFFTKLNSVFNFLMTSTKRELELKSTYQVKVTNMIASRDLETGRGVNQICTLGRLGATR